MPIVIHGTRQAELSGKNMPKLIMLSAPSASGKSTLAADLLKKDGNAIRINRDDLRKMSIPKWTPKREKWIIDAEIALAKAAGAAKQNIIIDDTNLLPRDEERWKGVATELGYTFEKKVLNVSLSVCIERDAKRGPSKIGRSAIERQFLKAGLWESPEVICHNCLGESYAGLGKEFVCETCCGLGKVVKKTVIFDIDGTLADLTHRVPWITVGATCPNCIGAGNFIESWANPTTCSCSYCSGTGKIQRKDHGMFYSLVFLDKPIDIVVRWIKACSPDFHILLVSGRSPETSEVGTIEWLESNTIPYDHLLMRRANVHGPDDEEKQLILDMILKAIPKEDIAFVVDDRPRVVDMWKRNGLRVFPVRGRDDDEFYKEMDVLEATHPRPDLEA